MTTNTKPWPFDLKAQTEAELRTLEQARKDKAKRDAQVEAAPASDPFNLCGSDRPADVAAAAGQKELF